MLKCIIFVFLFLTNVQLNANIPALVNNQFTCYHLNEELFPLVISPKKSNNLTEFTTWSKTHHKELSALLAKQGAVLLRGFAVNSAEDFATTVKAVVGRPLIEYRGEGSRKTVCPGVYTSTEAPPEFKIPLHNELTCTSKPVDYICFYCDIAPEPGTGQTLIGRTADATLALMAKPEIWNLFENRLLKYISRHPPDGHFLTRVNPTHRTWPQVFDTFDRNEVERICKEKEYEYKWDGDWLELVRRVPGIRGPDQYFDHPYWFNQAHLYHSNPRLMGGPWNYFLASLLYSSTTRQYDIEFDDGSNLPVEVVYGIYDVMDEKTIKFDWVKGDILLLDNRRALHGRAPYEGQRRILVTMIQ